MKLQYLQNKVTWKDSNKPPYNPDKVIVSWLFALLYTIIMDLIL